MSAKLKYPNTATMLPTKEAWFYQQRSGIIVVAERRGANGVHVATTQCRITWAKLCAAVDLHRKIKRQNKR